MPLTLVFILLIVILILLIQLKSDFNSKIKELQLKTDLLLKRRPEEMPAAERQEAAPPVEEAPVITPAAPEDVQTTAVPAEEATPAAAPGPVIPEAREAAFTVPPETPAPAPKAPTFWERNPDLEKFIGENLFNKIGIGILVLGIGFFLKYAIDKNWINETGRTFIGILCGAALIGVAHRMRKSFAAFSSVLVGGGVAVLYFTITIAFQQYHLIGQTLAFLLMIFITAFTVVLSLSYDRRELAILAILGGFSSPLLVSTGTGNAAVLFTYILILNIGMLVLAYYKKWNIVNVICYAATVLLYGSWLTYSIQQESPARPVPYGTALLFATLFYIVFFLMNVINNIRQRASFKATEIIILLSNTFLYYAAGMVILRHIQHGLFQGLFTALIAVFNFIFAYSLYRNQRVDRNLIYLLIGLVLSFLSLAAPIQLEGNYITLFWAVESVLLLWLSQRSGIQLMKYASVAVLFLMAVSLCMDWSQLYIERRYTPLWPVINRGFITSAVCTAAVFLLRRLLKKDAAQNFFPGLPAATFRLILALGLVVMAYIGILLELEYQSDVYWNSLTVVITGAYNYLFLAAILYLSRNAAIPFRTIALMLSAVALLAFPVLYNSRIIDIRNDYLAGGVPLAYFLVHYGLVAALFAMLYQAYRTVLSLGRRTSIHIFQWACAITVLYVLSASLDHIVALSAYKPKADIYGIIANNHKTGYALLWGAFAFVLMYLGLRWRSRQVRIISISVFALTLLKLFLFDLRGLSEGGKIAAFISLGILLLVISFMYQRLKKILLTDDHQKAE